MSKQDGYSSRTAADLERKYNFGKTFAEVYDLVSEAQRAAQEAQNAFDGLNQEQIFNLLTNYGESQGIYRDDNGDVYVNASYIKGGTISGDHVKVEAATITGQLVATQIDTKDLKVLAANITGQLTAGQIDATNLKVSAANITGKLSASQVGLYGGYFDIYDSSGTAHYGSMGYGSGLTSDGETTLGVVMSAAGNTNLGEDGNYFIATNKGVRMQSGASKVFAVDGSAYLESNGNSVYVSETGAYTKVNGVVSVIGGCKMMLAADYDAVTDWSTVLREGETAWRCELSNG